jgi:hypothetical protein
MTTGYDPGQGFPKGLAAGFFRLYPIEIGETVDDRSEWRRPRPGIASLDKSGISCVSKKLLEFSWTMPSVEP